jgi:hypothetical protein
MEVHMSGIPDRLWDDIQRGRDPDSLYWEQAREDALQRTQREAEFDMEQWESDIHQRNRSTEDIAQPVPESPAVSAREDIQQCRRDLLDQVRVSVWLDPNLGKDWVSRLANLTDVGWERELSELRRDVVREEESWRRANADNPFPREQYGDYLRDLRGHLEDLELKCRNFSQGR